jgi:hypothetical protein
MFTELTQTLADPEMPTLQAALDPAELDEHLKRVLPAPWGEVRDIGIKVLQHRRARRCTVDITLQTTTGEHELIGKVYAEDRSDVYQAMKQISQSGFGPGAEFSIPQPLAYLPELHLLLQEKVHGQSAREIFSNGSEHKRVLAAERCARWLARFHALAPRSGLVFALTPELLEHWMSGLAKWTAPHNGQLIDKAVSLVERLKIAALKLDNAELCACHGAYCYQQIILTEGRMVTFDWDGFCVANPGLDIARFIILLQQLALKSKGSINALDEAIEAFFKTYIVLSRFEVARYVPIYKAAHCLRRAKKHLKSESKDIEKAEAMLDEGLRALEEDV